MVESIEALILIFGLNLSIGSPYYQGGRIWMNFRLSKCLIWDDIVARHTNSLTKHSAQKSLHKSEWSGQIVDFGSAQVRMIRPWAGWSGPGELWASGSARLDDPALHRMIRIWEIQCVFSLFCQHPGWSEVTPDDPGSSRKHTMVTFGGGTIYTPSPLSFISLSPRPTSTPKH